MNTQQVISFFAGAVIVLSACTATGTPKAVGTVTTSVATQAAKPAATAVTKSALPAGGDVNITPTPVLSDTAPITPTATVTVSFDISATNGLTLTVDLTPTVEVTPTETSTGTPTTTDQQGTSGSVATDIKTITTKGKFNVRSGPGANYKVIGFVGKGQTIEVIGISADKRWWEIKCTKATEKSCWIVDSARYLITNK